MDQGSSTVPGIVGAKTDIMAELESSAVPLQASSEPDGKIGYAYVLECLALVDGSIAASSTKF